MTDEGDEQPFRIDQSAAVVAEIRRAMELARSQGRLRLFGQALKWVYEELERTPRQFGESRGYLEGLDLWLRIGFAGPLSVQYGVHFGERRVFLQRFRWGR